MTDQPELPTIHSAEAAAYSSVVGQSILLLNEAGACIGQLAVLGTDDPQAIAREIAAAISAPNRRAYQVGVAVGKASSQPPQVTPEQRPITKEHAQMILPHLLMLKETPRTFYGPWLDAHIEVLRPIAKEGS